MNCFFQVFMQHVYLLKQVYLLRQVHIEFPLVLFSLDISLDILNWDLNWNFFTPFLSAFSYSVKSGAYLLCLLVTKKRDWRYQYLMYGGKKRKNDHHDSLGNHNVKERGKYEN